MQYKRTVLNNGLRVITIPMPSFESATVLLMVKAGSRYETKQNNGISHFLEHMAFKGTLKRQSALEISSLIDGIGGEVNAFTSKEYTGYYIKSSANNITLSMDVLSDMLKNSLFKEEEISKEKGVIIEEINLYEDTPVRKIGDVYERLLYGNTSMGWDIAGEKEVIRKITRKDFLAYIESLYSSDNFTLVVAGGVTAENVNKLAEKFFSDMKRFKINSFDKVKEDQRKPQVLIKSKKTEQTHIALGVRTVPLEHPDRYPLMILSAILGGGMSSRLFYEVREKRGLGYYVRTNSDQYEDAGTLVTTAGVDTKRVEEAVKVILDEYKSLVSGEKPVIAKELKKAKEFCKGHFVLELEDSRSVASFYAGQELLEKSIENPEQVIERIDSITFDQVNDIAKKYLINNTLNLAVIGNFDEAKKSGKVSLQSFEKMLTL